MRAFTTTLTTITVLAGAPGAAFLLPEKAPHDLALASLLSVGLVTLALSMHVMTRLAWSRRLPWWSRRRSSPQRDPIGVGTRTQGRVPLTVVAALATALLPSVAAAQETRDALARQLTNPIADLISVPFQFDIDLDADGGERRVFRTLTSMPIVPVRLNANWNVISRTVLPVVYRERHVASGETLGLGDTLQTIFLSPTRPGVGGVIWGVGPALLLPTATEGAFGRDQWGSGPAAVALTQRGRWTVGMHVNHVRSVSGGDDRPDVNDTLLQPFSAYALGGGRMVFVGMEASYAWSREQWTTPVTASVGQVFVIGPQRLSLQIGGRYFVEAAPGTPEWGVRTTLTMLFPRRGR